VINPEKEDPVERIMSETGGRGVEVAFEASGADGPPQQALDVLAPGGRMMWIGIPGEEPVPLDVHEARRKELEIKMVRRFCHDYPTAIELVASGSIDVKSMVTHTFPLQNVEQAFKIVEDYSDGVIRAVIEI
jgi:threonine dehydrogenase-like Zn-dependent dehydrogenase